METVLPILIVIVAAIAARGWYSYGKRCRSCNKWNALIKYGKPEFLKTIPKERTKTYKDMVWKNNKGQVEHYRERTIRVPYNVNIYRVFFKCKYCNKEWNKILEEGQGLGDGTITVLVVGIIISGIVYYVNPKTQNAEPVKAQDQVSVSDSMNKKETNLEPTSVTNTVSNVDSSSKQQTIIAQIDSSEIKKNTLQSDTITQRQEDIKDTNEITSAKSEIISNNQNEQIKVTKETPEYKRMELAIEMLQRGKSIDEIVDSTFLSRRQVRKLKHNL